MLGWIKRKLAEAALKNSQERSQTLVLESITTCRQAWVLFHFKDYNSFPIEQISEVLKPIVPRATFKGVTYCANTKKIEKAFSRESLHIINPKDLDFRLRPSNWPSEPVVIFDFRKQRDIPTQYLLQSEQTVLRAGGRKPWNQQLLDLMIQQKEDSDYIGLAEQLAVYFKMINSNSNAA